MKLLVSSAQLQCSFGNAHAPLTIAPANEGFVGTAPMATVRDYAPFVNIAPFGMCRSTANPQVVAASGAPQPCVPVTSSWSGGSPDVEIKGLAVLVDTSTCSCQWGGTIQSASAGQETVTVEQG